MKTLNKATEQLRRRDAACAACEGIPTEALENGAIANLVNALQNNAQWARHFADLLNVDEPGSVSDAGPFNHAYTAALAALAAVKPLE